MAQPGSARDPSLDAYTKKRNFRATPEPRGRVPRGAAGGKLSFVVQKHRAHRAGLHWDFRLEHDGVLWSWAVRAGPSLDPADKRLAIHVEDHPLDYAGFQGEIPEGEYGAGTVETWDRGTWTPLDDDPAEGMRKGALHFTLDGARLRGRFTLARMRTREKRRQEAWLLIKGHDAEAREGVDATALEQQRPLAPPPRPATRRGAPVSAPMPGAKRGALPESQAPELASIAEEPPERGAWLSEIKFDGYRLLVWLDHGRVRLRTRTGQDWTARLPALARAVAGLKVEAALLDGELVALREDGTSNFPDLQAALSAGRDGQLFYYVFDLLHLDGWDLRPCALRDRKAALEKLADWGSMLRYSTHVEGDSAAVRRRACAMNLEGILCKRADAPYRPGRGRDWLKLKCQGREEFVVLGWTPPAGSRRGFGALHLGYYDPEGALHYAGGVGSGFDARELTALHKRLDPLAAPMPKLLVSREPVDAAINWVRPDLVAEVQFAAWSGGGRLRQAVFLGLREDKPARDVVRAIADPASARTAFAGRARAAHRGARIVTARAPEKRAATVEGVAITHPDRPLWPGVTKQDLAEYWQRVAAAALPGLVRRPLAVVRCPEGIDGEHFFQKHGHHALPPQIREGKAEGAPYLAIDDAAGLVACAQMSAIELHCWGATEADPAHPDRVVFDLDPGEGVAFRDVVTAALEVRDRLRRLGLTSFCRTTGGKGLHVVVPLTPAAAWPEVKAWSRAFAEVMGAEQPERYLTKVAKAERRGRILIDWLRNAPGATAIASFCPRARPGATVATPLAWEEVTPRLDPVAFTLQTVPARIARRGHAPWQGFEALQQRLPQPAARPAARRASAPKTSSKASGARIVHAPKPRRR
ncbi:MAG: DNA ligase D [Alphaproteobacteria bacterium]|nr:DNA ligase D [Alphaproteobacteria bacterium]